MYKLILISLPFFVFIVQQVLKKKSLKIPFNLKLTQRRTAIKNKLQYEDWNVQKKSSRTFDFLMKKKYIPKYQQITGNNFCNMCEFFWLLHSQIGSKFFKVLAKLTKFQIESNKKIQILYSTTLVLIFIPKLKLFKIKTKASNPYSFGTTDICFYCAPIPRHLLLLCTNSQLPTFIACIELLLFPNFSSKHSASFNTHPKTLRFWATKRPKKLHAGRNSLEFHPGVRDMRDRGWSRRVLHAGPTTVSRATGWGCP